MNGNVPDPALLDTGFVNDTNSGWDGPCDDGVPDGLVLVGGPVAVVPLTAPLGVEGDGGTTTGLVVAVCPAGGVDPDDGAPGLLGAQPDPCMAGDPGVHGPQPDPDDPDVHGPQPDPDDPDVHGPGGLDGGGEDG